MVREGRGPYRRLPSLFAWARLAVATSIASLNRASFKDHVLGWCCRESSHDSKGHAVFKHQLHRAICLHLTQTLLAACRKICSTEPTVSCEILLDVSLAVPLRTHSCGSLLSLTSTSLVLTREKPGLSTLDSTPLLTHRVAACGAVIAEFGRPWEVGRSKWGGFKPLK